MLRALLIDRSHTLAWFLPQLLARAGLTVDVISSSPLMRGNRFVQNCSLVPYAQSLIPTIQKHLANSYDWIILTEDGIIQEVLESTLSLEEKLQILPVQKRENFAHLFSKIGLSQAFARYGVPTPAFFIASDLTQALEAAEKLTYPVLCKIDRSAGGLGVYECHCPSDLRSLDIFQKPVLIQKKIEGVELDLSALYFEGQLIHFSYAKVEKSRAKFGPSFLRTYRSLSVVEKAIFEELSQIGKALGCHGFANISCMESEGVRFYFEVDMRPNVWTQTPRYFGEDPALRIRNWFLKGQGLQYPVKQLPNQPTELQVPYFLRLKRWELFCNRYQVWKFIPLDDPKLVMRLVIHDLFSVRAFIKQIIPEKYHPILRKIKRLVCKGFVF